MKFLELSNIIKTNRLFEKLRDLDPQLNIEIEVYSCKQTKHQKSHITIPKPFRFYVSALEMAFPDYDFSSETISSFKQSNFKSIKRELSYIFFTAYKNCEDVSRIIDFIEMILQQSMDMEKSKFYTVDDLFINETGFYKVFILHDRSSKRVLIIKSQKNEGVII